MTTQTIIITGAGSGIGRATARSFLDAGWRVGLIGRRAESLAETAAVGRAKGVALDANIVENCVKWVKDNPPIKPSMLVDLERGRKLELDWLTGTIHRLGLETGVPTPTHDTIYAALHPFVNGAPAA